jgi:methionine biosynthesis protein MetW
MAQLELVHTQPKAPAAAPRADHVAISRLIADEARVVDIGCGDGALMRLLVDECKARVRGVEIDPGLASQCARTGLSVVQGDAEQELALFPDEAFDAVVFSHALQRLRDPVAALQQAGRVGKRVIASTANAGHWRVRARLMLTGRLERSDRIGDGLPHPLSIRDFAELAGKARLEIERAIPMSRGNPGAPFARTLWRANLFAEEAVFVLKAR